jgi:hypothetical protein
MEMKKEKKDTQGHFVEQFRRKSILFQNFEKKDKI